MRIIKTTRRGFLRAAGTTLAAAPLLSLPAASPAQQSNASNSPARQAGLGSGMASAVRLSVRDFGAIGDGKTKDTLAFQQALDRASFLGGGQVFVPAGDYLIGAIALRSNTLLNLDANATLLGSPDIADYPLTQVRWEGRWTKGRIGLVSAMDAENIFIAGPGKITGSPAIRGRLDAATGLRNPALLEFINCVNVRVDDCITEQNEMWSIHPVYCTDVQFVNVTVRGGADGIDMDSCTHVLIEGCNFSTGDDCISLKSGRGSEGYAINRPTRDVTISNCTFADTHWACIGIGSETSGGIADVRIENCKCTGARTFAIYIKSRPGRGASLENISVDGFDVAGAQQGFLRINILDSGKQDEFPVAGDEGIPTVRNFRFKNIRVTDVPVLVQATSILPTKPLDGFSLTNVTGTCGKGIFLANITHAELKDIHVTGFSGALVNTYNVTGTGLEGASPLEATKIPDPVKAPAAPYKLN